MFFSRSDSSKADTFRFEMPALVVSSKVFNDASRGSVLAAVLANGARLTFKFRTALCEFSRALLTRLNSAETSEIKALKADKVLADTLSICSDD